uniref:GIY-YIG endonuclease n=1 Tax=Ramaria cf. rubripermanens TaxID=2016387 RepID=UPI0022378AF3
AKCSGKIFIGCKLSNSGEPLKLMVPSYGRKAISGWINFPCTVISQKIDEKKMGNRGSKSEFNPDLYSILIFTIITFYALLCLWSSEYTDQIYFISAAAPIVTYINTDQAKLQILKENASKSGVYRWVNKENGKCYIGSSIHLSRRFSCYYSINFLMKNRSIINNALLKYGYAKFSLEILEYCEPIKCIKR